MPTHDVRHALDAAALRRLVDAATTGTSRATGLGVEVELLPLATSPRIRRLPIATGDGTLARLSAAPAIQEALDADQRLDEEGWWSGGDASSRVTFEPGGQLEVSSCYREYPVDALRSVDRATSLLAASLAPTGARLAAAGLDLWAPGTATQQRTTPRYPAMGRYLAARGPAGRTMMRDTCALQLNLDLSDEQEARQRWLVANLLAPLATATFAASPSTDGGVRSLRSLTWRRVDPTRTGFPPGLTDERVGLADQLERFALDADVLLVAEEGGGASPGRPGWRFADWMAHGDARYGWPTTDDLAVHLSTLFPEVRPRGYLEVRSIDALPARWRHVPAVLYAGATYDHRSRDRILEVLRGRPIPLHSQLMSAATVGVSDPVWCAIAVEVWSFALEGAARLARGSFEPEDLRTAERFLDRFTLRGRAPADELADVWRAGGPSAALRWAGEPTSELGADASGDTPATSQQEVRR